MTTIDARKHNKGMDDIIVSNQRMRKGGLFYVAV